MAIQATYADGTTIASASGGDYAGTPVRTVLTGVFDASRGNVISGDVIPVVSFPAGTIIENVVLEVLTGQATVTLALGITGTPAGYLAATAVATAGAKTAGTVASLVADGVGALNTAAGTVDLLVGGATAATVKVRVHVICTIV